MKQSSVSDHILERKMSRISAHIHCHFNYIQELERDFQNLRQTDIGIMGEEYMTRSNSLHTIDHVSMIPFVICYHCCMKSDSPQTDTSR